MPARAAPSFDCRKAASETEKAICASPALGLLDRQQQRAWRAMNEALQEHPAFSALKQEQRAWLALRERCAADTACIAEAYRRRISQLQGGPGEPWAGVFEMPGTGSLTIYPVAASTSAPPESPRRYRFSLRTAEPKAARWSCEWQGDAVLQTLPTPMPARLQLLLAGAPASSAVAVQAQSDGSLEIANDAAAQSAAETLCGNGGSFAFRYRRISADH